MPISESCPVKFAVRGAVLLLGLVLLIFYIYPPLLLFIRGRGFSIADSGRTLLFPLLNSLRLAVSVCAASTIVGGLLAAVSVNSGGRFSRVIDNGVLVSFAIPPYILALAWMQIAGCNGYLERAVHLLGIGDGWQSNPYSITAAAVVMTLHLYPLTYMSIRNGLMKLPAEFAGAALLAGASTPRVAVEIITPLLMPNILSTGLLVFSRTMANFSVPALLCLPVGIDLVPTGIFSALSGLRSDQAAVLSLLLVLVSTGLHVAHGLMLQKKNFEISPGCSSGAACSSGRSRTGILAAVTVFFLFACVLPLGAMLVSSFLLRWGLPVRAEYLTLNNYREIFFGGDTLHAFRNSLVYGGSAALAASVVGGGAAFIAAAARSGRQPRIAANLIEAAAAWPMAIPNTVLAVAAVFAWNRPPLRLYGTPLVIIVTYGVLFTPIIMKQVSGLAAVENRRLTDAARTSGAGGIRTFFTVSLPLAAPGFISGILICMMIALREIPISLMLYSAGQETVGVLLFGMQSQSYGLEMTSAVAVLLIVIILAGNRCLEFFSSGRKNE